MHDLPILYDLFVIFLCAMLVVIVFQRLRLPHLVGYLISGIAAGPYGLNLITRHEEINVLAEIGVALLLFTIGLEFSLKELRRIKRDVVLGGGLQVMLTAIAAYWGAKFFGYDTAPAIFFGLLLALSSTAIVLGVLVSRGELDSPSGRTILAILLFQDLCVVPMLLMTPLLAAGDLQIMPLALSLGKAMLLVAAVLLLAIFAVPRAIEIIVRARLREILVLGTVMISLGIAWLTSWLGLSLALGAFIAGLAISESPYSHQVTAEILPFKDVFYSLFFISIGMLLNLEFLIQHAGMLVVLVVCVIVIKAMLAGGIARLLSGSNRMAMVVGLGVAQVGEFSFVLAKLGFKHHLIDDTIYQGFLAIAVMTMILAPFLMSAAPRLARHLPQALARRLAAQQNEQLQSKFGGLRDHTIIVGFGLNGRYLVRVLKESSIPYCILETNPQTVREGLLGGEAICFGDASRVEIMRLVKPELARILVITVAELPITGRIVAIARQHYPGLYIIARTKFAGAAAELYHLGANQVIAEEFETAIELFVRVLVEYDLPRNVIDAYVEVVQREGSSLMRKSQLPLSSIERLRQILAGNIVENFLLLEHSPAVGKSLVQLDLRRQTGATILVIVRDNNPIVNPASELQLLAGDLLVIMGTHQALDQVKHTLIGVDLG